MSALLVDIVSGFLILAGAAFFLTGAIGYLRMPDLFTRLHAASLADTTGMALILAGLAVKAGIGLIAVKLVFLILFLLFMGPATTHALAAAALAAGLKPMAEDLPKAKSTPSANKAKTGAKTGAKTTPKTKPTTRSSTKPAKGRR